MEPRQKPRETYDIRKPVTVFSSFVDDFELVDVKEYTSFNKVIRTGDYKQILAELKLRGEQLSRRMLVYFANAYTPDEFAQAFKRFEHFVGLELNKNLSEDELNQVITTLYKQDFLGREKLEQAFLSFKINLITLIMILINVCLVEKTNMSVIAKTANSS